MEIVKSVINVINKTFKTCDNCDNCYANFDTDVKITHEEGLRQNLC